jgi:hypothetical protein
MTIKDPEIWRVARELIEYNATTALQAANGRAQEAAEANDRETEAGWLRIAKAGERVARAPGQLKA